LFGIRSIKQEESKKNLESLLSAGKTNNPDSLSVILDAALLKQVALSEKFYKKSLPLLKVKAAEIFISNLAHQLEIESKK